MYQTIRHLPVHVCLPGNFEGIVLKLNCTNPDLETSTFNLLIWSLEGNWFYSKAYYNTYKEHSYTNMYVSIQVG